MDERKDARTDGRTWATLNALPHSTNSGGIINFKQSNFVSDKTTTMQFRKMQNEIYGSFVTIRYQNKCTNPLYSKFTSNKFNAYIFLLQALPGWCLCSNSNHRKVFTPIYKPLTLKMGQLLQQKSTDMAYPSLFDNKLPVKHWQELQN